MKERIRQVMEYAGMSQQEFAAKLEISPASLSSIYTGRTNPTNNHVMAIHRAFPEIDINWLLFGEGRMCSKPTLPAEEEGAGDIPSPGGVSGDAGGVVPGRVSPLPGEEVFPARGGRDIPASARSTARRENIYANPLSGGVAQGVNFIDKKERKIKEIRVFFDDGTYESFVPSSK